MLAAISSFWLGSSSDGKGLSLQTRFKRASASCVWRNCLRASIVSSETEDFMAASLTPLSSGDGWASWDVVLKTGSSRSGDSFAIMSSAATLWAQYGIGAWHVHRQTSWLARMATETCSKRPLSFASLTTMDFGVCCASSTALSRKSFRPASQAVGPATEAMGFCKSSFRGMASK